MGVGIEQWRARIGRFSGGRSIERIRIDRLTLRSKHSLILNFIVVTFIVLSLCGDVELNPGPRREYAFSDTPYGQPGPAPATAAQDYANASYYASPRYAQNQNIATEYGNDLYRLIDTRLSQLDQKMDRILQQQLSTDRRIADMQTSLKTMSARQDKVEHDLAAANRELYSIRNEHGRTVSRVEAMDRRYIRNNVRVFNLPTDDAKTEPELRQKFVYFVREKLDVDLTGNDINRIYFSGRGRGKHLVVEFVMSQSKRNVMTSLGALRTNHPDCKVSVTDDLTPTELNNRKANLPLYKQLKAKAGPNDRVELRRGDMYVNRVRKSRDDVCALLQISQAITMDHQAVNNPAVAVQYRAHPPNV